MCATLTRVIDEWIIMLNRSTIDKLQTDLFRPTRSSDIFCVIGPSGSGKSVVMNHVCNRLAARMVKSDVFAEFVVGETAADFDQGYFSALMLESADPHKSTVLVFDCIDTVANVSGTVRSIKQEYEEYKRYAQTTNAIVLLLNSTKDFAVRTWLREIRAHQYYMRDRMTWSEQTLLAQQIQTVCSMRSDDPIRAFHGDFRRMGIDLVACAREASEAFGGADQNVLTSGQTHRTVNVFDMTKHLLGWPVSLSQPMVFAEESSSLWNMCAGNQTGRVSQSSSKDGKVFDELVRTTMDLSDCIMFREKGNDIEGLLIEPRRNRQPKVDTNQFDLFLLTSSLYQSNRRLGSHLQKSTKLQFVPSVPRATGPRPDLDNPNLQIFDNEKKHNKT